jgi:phosphomannomutase
MDKRGLSDLLDGLVEPEESKELRFRVTGGPAATAQVAEQSLDMLRRIATKIKADSGDGNAGDDVSGWRVEEVNYEGLRVNFDFEDARSTDAQTTRRHTGWCMLRPSLHEPIISMQIESDRAGGAAVAARKLLIGDSSDSASVPVVGSDGNDVASGDVLGFTSMGDVMDISPLIKLAREN